MAMEPITLLFESAQEPAQVAEWILEIRPGAAIYERRYELVRGDFAIWRWID
jgi:hypothetical protein